MEAINNKIKLLNDVMEFVECVANYDMLENMGEEQPGWEEAQKSFSLAVSDSIDHINAPDDLSEILLKIRDYPKRYPMTDENLEFLFDLYNNYLEDLKKYK
jgi:hypothetical protein